jgi:hypothetical protein
MEKRYRVVKQKIDADWGHNGVFHQVGVELAENYDLLHSGYNLDEVITIWRKYSDTFAGSNWMEPTKKDVERAFSVELEEVLPKSGAW